MNNTQLLEGEYVYIRDFMSNGLLNIVLDNDTLEEFLLKQKSFSPLRKPKNYLLIDPTADNIKTLEYLSKNIHADSNLFLIYETSSPDFRNKYLNSIKKADNYHNFESIRPFETSKLKSFLNNFPKLDTDSKQYLTENPPLITKTVRIDGEKKEVNVINLNLIENFAIHQEIEFISAKEYFTEDFFEIWEFLDAMIAGKNAICAKQLSNITKANFEKIFNILKSQVELYILVKMFADKTYNVLSKHLKDSGATYYISPQRFTMLNNKTSNIPYERLIFIQQNLFDCMEDSRQGLEINSVLLSFISGLINYKV